MRKLLLSAFIIILFFNYHAQVWCTPGSEWHFTNYAAWGDGYIKFNYTHDTLIGNKTCNIIKYNAVGFNSMLPNNGYYNYISYYFTYTANKVVYIKDVMGTTNNFDTLYNYNAGLATSWLMAPKSLTVCNGIRVIVADTGRRVIQGQSLKWLLVAYNNNSNSFLSYDTIYERFGALKVFPYYPYNFCPQSTDYQRGGPMRCFSDNQIINYRNNYPGNCEYFYTSGIHELKNINGLIKIYPNPASNRFNISLSNIDVGDGLTMSLSDVTGREIKSIKLQGTDYSGDLSDISNGIYLIRLIKNKNLIYISKLVKQD